MSLEAALIPLKSVHVEDDADWKQAQKRLLSYHHTFWYAGSGLDLSPIMELADERVMISNRVPRCVARHISHPLFIFSDYSTDILEKMNRLYLELDTMDPKNLGWKLQHTMAEYWSWNHQQGEIEVEEMIPLQFFVNTQHLREEFQNYHPCMTSSSLPDDVHHATYLVVTLLYQGRKYHREIFFFHCENVLLWNQFFLRYAIPIDVVYAKCVGGKSGSWEDIYTEESSFVQHIVQAPHEIRPKIWAMDVPRYTGTRHGQYGVVQWLYPPWNTIQMRNYGHLSLSWVEIGAW
jgi:hypothetical protein